MFKARTDNSQPNNSRKQQVAAILYIHLNMTLNFPLKIPKFRRMQEYFLKSIHFLFCYFGMLINVNKAIAVMCLTHLVEIRQDGAKLHVSLFLKRYSRQEKSIDPFR